MKRYEIKHLLKEDVSALIGTTICVKGWVRTKRGNKNVAFLAVKEYLIASRHYLQGWEVGAEFVQYLVARPIDLDRIDSLESNRFLHLNRQSVIPVAALTLS